MQCIESGPNDPVLVINYLQGTKWKLTCNLRPTRERVGLLQSKRLEIIRMRIAFTRPALFKSNFTRVTRVANPKTPLANTSRRNKVTELCDFERFQP